MSHVLPPPRPRAKWQPLTCKRKEEKTHMCWAEEQRDEEASEESTGDGRLTGCGNTPFHSLVWQKNKHRATKLSLSPALMDKRWFFPNETCWPSGNGRRGLTNGSAPPEPDTVVLRVSGPLGRVSHSSALLSAEPLNSSCLMTTATWPDGRKEAFITTPALHFHLFLH